MVRSSAHTLAKELLSVMASKGYDEGFAKGSNEGVVRGYENCMESHSSEFAQELKMGRANALRLQNHQPTLAPTVLTTAYKI